MTHILRFTVPGRPVGKERPRVVRGHTFTPQRTLDYEALVRAHARNAITDAEWVCDDTPCAMRITTYFCTPTNPDIDNCCKSILDALNQIAFNDDVQVKILSVRVRNHPLPLKGERIEVRIRKLLPDLPVEDMKAQRAAWYLMGLEYIRVNPPKRAMTLPRLQTIAWKEVNGKLWEKYLPAAQVISFRDAFVDGAMRGLKGDLQLPLDSLT